MSEKHIFLSYSHEQKDIVYKIKDRLKAEGHNVWIDCEEMGASLMDSMASAVENAKLVLICVSESYRDSENCELEAKYAKEKQIPIIPLMMQRHFKPDGWLGMLMADKLYINFDGKFEFNDAFNMLMKQIELCTGEQGTSSPFDEYNCWFMDSRETLNEKIFVNWSLIFNDNSFTGQGEDKIGKFKIRQGKLKDGARIEFIKDYGTHSIWYEGVCDRVGIPKQANGTWKIMNLTGTWGMEHV